MHEIRMPQMGQSVEEASIVMWLKKEGEPVSVGDPIFSIQTDKAEIECESTAEGVLRKILVDADVMVPVLTVVALVGKPDEKLPDLSQYGSAKAQAKADVPAPAPASAAPAAAAGPAVAAAVGTAPAVSAPASPRARAKARELGVDVSRIAGTGAGGRVIEADVAAYAAAMGSIKATPTARRAAQNAGIDLSSVSGSGPKGKITKADVAAAKTKPSLGVPGRVERVPLTPMRRIIARRMAESMYSAPHYYITVEVDMSSARDYRAGVTSFKLSYNDMVLRACVNTLVEFPGVNARWTDDAIEQLEDVNLGVAVALPGGLIVPVIKQAQAMTLEQLASNGRTLIEKARTGKLLPDDFSGNTFTISNLGPFGVDEFTAIINQPDSAILAVGQMKDRPVVIDGGIFVRPIMKLTLSSDHRVIDGALAAQFMGRLKEILETASF